MAKPNILYLNSHDTGRCIQPYGYAVRTPNLQRFAEQGVIFRRAFCAAPTCSPSRSALVTGSYPHENGMLGLAHRGFSLRDYGQHLVSTLRHAGYSTTLIGVQHVADDAAAIGYDRSLCASDTERKGPDIARGAARFLRERPAEPFYLEVGFFETHRKWPALAEDDATDFRLPPAPFPDTPETRGDFARFAKSAALLDDYMGTVLGALEETGLAASTLVVCTTDHGLALPGVKCNLTDAGTGVMLMMRGPGGFDGGRAMDALVSHVDVFPTLCDLLEIEIPPWLSGKSFMPIIRGEAEEVREEVFGEVTYHAAYEPQRAVRTKRWKYIRRFGDRRMVVLPNCDDSPTKKLLMEHGWGEREHPAEALYDLVFDPNEANNLAGDPSLATTLAEMRGRLERWMRETKDPLLEGPVPAPPGARVNDPDGMSPTEKPRVIGG